MGLVAAAKRVVVIMNHCSKKGDPKILKACALPLTGRRVVNRVISDLAVMNITDKGLVVRELAPGITAEEVQYKTKAKLIFPEA